MRRWLAAGAVAAAMCGMNAAPAAAAPIGTFVWDDLGGGFELFSVDNQSPDFSFFDPTVLLTFADTTTASITLSGSGSDPSTILNGDAGVNLVFPSDFSGLAILSAQLTLTVNDILGNAVPYTVNDLLAPGDSNSTSSFIQVVQTPVPEPASLVLLTTGLIGLLLVRRRFPGSI